LSRKGQCDDALSFYCNEGQNLYAIAEKKSLQMMMARCLTVAESGEGCGWRLLVQYLFLVEVGKILSVLRS
jgi:hypothetical protein